MTWCSNRYTRERGFWGRERWVCGWFRGREVGFESEKEKEEILVAAKGDKKCSVKKNRERERERERENLIKRVFFFFDI
jgi:hypothetical protein